VNGTNEVVSKYFPQCKNLGPRIFIFEIMNVFSIHLAEDKDQLWDLMNTIMNPQVP
jgi:hypothetical protein